MSLNPLDRKAKLKALRESWAKTCNARLDETARIDHRSLEDQGSDLEPTIHEGYAARAIERAGGVSERCEANREIRRSNGLLTAVRTELGRIFDRLGELFAAKIGRCANARRGRNRTGSRTGATSRATRAASSKPTGPTTRQRSVENSWEPRPT